MTRSRRASLCLALMVSLSIVASTNPLTAAEPSTMPPDLGAAAGTSSASPTAATVRDGAEALADIGRSMLRGGLGATLDDAIASSTSNPCSGDGPLKRSHDGSLTVLLLGSDYRRKPYIGERTDTVIALNIARDGRVSMAAIPRDTVRIPLAKGGTSGARRVNALYIGYKRTKVGPHGVDCIALDKVRRDIARTLGTYIPYYALIRMDEFQWLIDSIGGIRMDIRMTLIDYHYSSNRRKIYVPERDDYRMNGGGNCGRKPTLCRSALRYARSRYGTEGGTSNSDFRRVRRQQEIVFYAIQRVLARGNGLNLMRLVAASKTRIFTNLPKNATGALDLYAAAVGARFRASDGKVFGPTRWAAYTGRYTFQLRLSEVRAWVDHHFRAMPD